MARHTPEHPESKKSFWGQLWSWQVVGSVAGIVLAGGLSLMSGAAPLADIFYLVGFILLIAKICTLSDHEVGARSVVVSLLVLLMSAAIGFNRKKNQLWPFKLGSEVHFSCLATNLGYPNDTLDGIGWQKEFADVRFTIKSSHAPAVVDFDANLSTLSDREVFQALEQTGGVCPVKFYRGPNGIEQLPDILILDKDGGPPAHTKPDVQEQFNKLSKDSTSYQITCSRLESTDKLTIRMWMMDANNPGNPSKGFRVQGTYDTPPSENSRPVAFNQMCNIER